jgi:hypothetical protein
LLTKIEKGETGRMVDFSLLCLNSTENIYTHQDESRQYKSGIWTEPQLCPKGKSFCGTKLEHKSKFNPKKLLSIHKGMGILLQIEALAYSSRFSVLQFKSLEIRNTEILYSLAS